MSTPASLLEFMFETTRTIATMILSGVTLRYPKMRVIVPHAATALSIFAKRVDTQIAGLLGKPDAKFPSMAGGRAAQALLRPGWRPGAGAAAGDLRHRQPQPHLYGSDWPFTPVKLCAELAAQLDASSQLAGGLLPKIMTGNAQSFFPQLEHKG